MLNNVKIISKNVKTRLFDRGVCRIASYLTNNIRVNMDIINILTTEIQNIGMAASWYIPINILYPVLSQLPKYKRHLRKPYSLFFFFNVTNFVFFFMMYGLVPILIKYLLTFPSHSFGVWGIICFTMNLKSRPGHFCRCVSLIMQ